MSIAQSRLVSLDVAAEPTTPDGHSAALATACAALIGDGGREIGVWEAGPGTDTDVESDEVFVVLSGSGRLTFADGSEIVLRPGVLVRLREGDRTTWEITTRLRKLYVSGG